MPQQSSLPREHSGESVAGATMYGKGGSRRDAAGAVPINGHPDRSGDTGSRGHAAAEDSMTIAFQHLDVVLAIATRAPGHNSVADGHATPEAMRLRAEFAQLKDKEVCFQVADNTNCIEDVLHAPSGESPEDAVVRRLSDALAAAESADHRHGEIYADALRLAIVTRLLCLRSEAQQSVEPAGRVIDGSADRQMRALQKWRLKRVVEYVDNHLSGKITLLDLAAVAGLSRMHFAAQFRAATGVRPHEYLLRRRIQRAEELLRQSTMTLVEIALNVGFQTQAHFTTVFKRFVGDTPYQWRNANAISG
jgi:AraC family transcriptional regulator